MNGMAQVAPFFVPNLCQCGHDYTVHTISASPALNTCTMCVRSSGVINKHFFAALMETLPASSFLSSLDYGYIQPGGFGFVKNIVTTNGSTLAVGTTVIPFGVAQIAVVQPGWCFTPVPQNPANQIQYQVQSINYATGQVTITNPTGIQFQILAGTTCIFTGPIGATMGAACPGNNYQRGG